MSPYFKDLLDSDMQEVSFINGDEIFIDRSAHLFSDIMQYLRNCEININEKGNLEGLKHEAYYYKLDNLAEDIDDMINNPPSEESKEYQLVDLKDLEKISSITPERGTLQCISDSYHIISVITHDYLRWECKRHGSLDTCPSDCNSSYTSEWATESSRRFLVAKK